MTTASDRIERLLADTVGHVFPLTVKLPEGGEFTSNGMLLRDFFASQALAGTAMHLADYLDEASDAVPQEAAVLARAAYLMADALLAARTPTS